MVLLGKIRRSSEAYNPQQSVQVAVRSWTPLVDIGEEVQQFPGRSLNERWIRRFLMMTTSSQWYSCLPMRTHRHGFLLRRRTSPSCSRTPTHHDAAAHVLHSQDGVL
ncbi:hypothetical protein AMECASPLE_027908, partial [Ameca splendens]